MNKPKWVCRYRKAVMRGGNSGKNKIAHEGLDRLVFKEGFPEVRKFWNYSAKRMVLVGDRIVLRLPT